MKPYALITGATSGIGLSLATIHASRKGNLIIIGQNSRKLSEVKKELETQFKIKVVAFSVDLTKPDSVKKIVTRVREQNLSVKYVINNAGFGLYGLFRDTDIERELKMIDLNVKVVTELSKAFLPDMIAEGRGHIMNVASVASFIPGPLMSVYYATKNYVLAFSEAINNELKGTGVSVTALCPGPTETNFTKTARGEKAKMLSRNLMSAEEVAVIGYEGMLKKKAIVIPGFKNKLLAFLPRLLPRSNVVSIVRNVAEKLSDEEKPTKE
ncbi:SDR family oxidoreductase [Candidatus Woesearchaeota archaeon]|nr:SDR family oxidoreductase [Candidatus Woesearchaeota archaeon]